MTGAPVVVLGVRRSGTTLLRVILDRSSELAIPDETYFVPQLADRHRGRVDPDAFLDDLRRLPTLRDWQVPLDSVRVRLRPEMPVGQAIAAVFEAYAETRGKTRWGDKTPMYMQHLTLLERLWPDAVYVHLIRDGRDTALSFLGLPEGIVTRTWAHPRSAADFACQWRTEVTDARALGRRVGSGRYLEVRYEELVAAPEREVERVCRFADLPYEAEMLDYAGRVDVSKKPHQQSLTQPPTPGLRDWRTGMSADDESAFEAVAGDLLADLGYEARPAPRRDARSDLRRLTYRARVASWLAASRALRHSPLWRRRHPPLV